MVKKNQSKTVNKNPSFTLMPSYFLSKLTKYRKDPNVNVIKKEYPKAERFSSLYVIETKIGVS